MGDITCELLPWYFDKWGVNAEYTPNWLTTGRSSGGFDAMRGVQIHHGASSPNSTLAAAIRYCTVTNDVAPVGNGTISRVKDGPKVVMWAALAANTAGKGGPRLSSRGVIPLDAANRLTFAFEAENNGVDEEWPDAMCDLYVRATVAVLDWANECTPGAMLGAGDVFSHAEWAPGRKSDPAGPSRFNDYQGGMWNMDRFRGEVFALMVGTPPDPGPDPAPIPPPVESRYTVQPGDGWWRISRALGYSITELQAFNQWPSNRVLHPGDVITAPGSPNAPCGQPQVCGLGDEGDVVSELQTLLLADGWYPYHVDGQYGPRTEQGVQKLQVYLASTGHYVGPIDGQYNGDTRSALCAFMQA